MQNQGDWWGEGDEMMFIDDAKKPHINGTGSEDYFLGAWGYGGAGPSPFGAQQPAFSFPQYGNPVNGGDVRGARGRSIGSIPIRPSLSKSTST